MSYLFCMLLAIIGTAAEVNGLSEAERRQQPKFRLSGHVLYAEPSGTCSLDDGTGATCVKLMNPKLSYHPQPGDCVTVAGLTEFHAEHSFHLLATQVQVRCRRPAPPIPVVTPADVADGRHDFRPVRLSGRVIDVRDDDIDATYRRLIVSSGTAATDVSIRRAWADADRLLGAEVEATGIYSPHLGGWRIFNGQGLSVSTPENFRIVKPAPASRFDVPPFERTTRLGPESLLALGPRSAVGTVAAAWGRNRLLVRTGTDHADIIRAELSGDRPLPPVGTHVKLVGQPATDFFSIVFLHADWREEPADGTGAHAEEPTAVTAAELLPNGAGQTVIPRYHGRTIRLAGVVRNVPERDAQDRRLYLTDGGRIFPVDISACPEAADGLERGCTVEATGICLLNAELWNGNAHFPRVDGFTLVVRTPADLRVVARPSWWTAERLFAVVCVLFALLVGIAVWNRLLDRAVRRRSRELLREQIAHAGTDQKLAERTRLAVELHDTIAQDLTGLALNIEAAKAVGRADPAAALPFLETTALKLGNCRTSLRNCIWDLRSNALDEANLADAVRRTVTPQIGGARLVLDCNVRTARLSENTVHQLLSILRELAINAVRHGHATTVAVTGARTGERLDFTITDDGCGFDPATRPGPDDGHFGLQGANERVLRLEGEMSVESRPGHGTTITLRNLSANA